MAEIGRRHDKTPEPVTPTAIPAGEVPADRLREIGERLANGHYDTTEAMRVVAGKIKRELGIP